MSIKTKWADFKALVASFVVWAETELKGRTGKEKARIVADEVCRRFPWKGPLRIVQRILVGYVASKIVEALNIVTDHDFAGIVADPEDIAAVADMPVSVLSRAQNIEAPTKQETVEERFNALCRQYGIDAEEMMGASEGAYDPPRLSPPLQPIADAELAEETETASKSYFQRSEFTCKCRCGTNKVQQPLIDMLNVIREEFGKPVTVTSGTRCVKHNAEVKGATNSNHLTGHAADIRCADRSMTPKQMYDVVMRLYNTGKIPQLAGISWNYDTIIHVDVSPKKADGTLRTW